MEAVIAGTESFFATGSSSDQAASHWLEAIWAGVRPGRSAAPSNASTLSELLDKTIDTIWLILFPELPPWVETFCAALRVIAFLVVAPFLFVGVLDFAEYVVFRTLGLRRRPVQVKAASASASASASTSSASSPGTSSRPRMLSPAQMHSGAYSSDHSSSSRRLPSSYNPAPLLTPGAYDAETLLRHRARSISEASAEAEEEWTRTGGSFARVAEVRANSPTMLKGEFISSSDHTALAAGSSPPLSPQFPKALLGVEGPLGALSESEAEGDTDAEEYEPDSPEVEFRPSFPSSSSARSSFDGESTPSSAHQQKRGLKGDRLYFTPVEKRRKPPSISSTSSAINGAIDDISPSSISAAAALAAASASAASAAAAAADLEPTTTEVGYTAEGAPVIFISGEDKGGGAGEGGTVMQESQSQLPSPKTRSSSP